MGNCCVSKEPRAPSYVPENYNHQNYYINRDNNYNNGTINYYNNNNRLSASNSRVSLKTSVSNLQHINDREPEGFCIFSSTYHRIHDIINLCFCNNFFHIDTNTFESCVSNIQNYISC